MSDLLDELRATARCAVAEKKMDAKDIEQHRRQDLIQADMWKADELIRHLPVLLGRAAERGEQILEVMKLEAALHRQNDVEVAMREYSLHGLTAENLFEGAWRVVEWLHSQKIPVVVRKQDYQDEGQGGRYWSEIILVAFW
ncbi:MAG: hypothetical protein ABI430_01995 [Candidatus Taylorbacteria bacterium]